MASDDVISGRVWTLGSGTLGLVSSDPVCIDKIRITWSGASVGRVFLETVNPDDQTAQTPIIDARTLALASGNIGLATQEFDMGGAVFQGVTKTAMTGVTGNVGVHIQTK